MLVRRLEISGVRNISSASLHPLSPITIIFGQNGAGKTSVLESLYLLSSAKSFRSHKLDPIIQYGLDNCTAFGEIYLPGRGFVPVGVERRPSKSDQASIIKLAGERVQTAAELAKALPLQVIYSDTFKLLEGSPSVRREYLDWGVFHVEHRYFQAWKSARRCLKQRNSLLRHDRIDRRQLLVWTQELAALGEEIDALRQAYLTRLMPIFEKTLSELIDLEGLSLSYSRGWDKNSNYADALEMSLDKDIQQRYTGLGPHRADLRIRYHHSNAAETLSRGQQKLVICALRVAQGYLLSELTQRACLYLIDDLPAELDLDRRKALCHMLERMNCQVVVTCVDPKDLQDCWSDQAEISMFHVEHGQIKLVNT